MRIIGGEFGGRRLKPPPHMPFTRPTTDIAKEGLFNILQNHLDFEQLHSLDLFGGTGAISYELASRGVPQLSIVENNSQMYDFIKKTSAVLGIKPSLYKQDVFEFIHHCRESYDFIFAGPPYALATIDDLPKLIFEKKLLNKGGWFVLEHTPRNNYENFIGFKHSRNYGTTVFSFFVNTQ